MTCATCGKSKFNQIERGKEGGGSGGLRQSMERTQESQEGKCLCKKMEQKVVFK